VLGVLVALPQTRSLVQAVDDRWDKWMWDAETPLLVSVARAFDFAGSAWVIAPVRVGVGVFLASRRAWTALTGWVVAIALSEAGVAVMKGAYGRMRPPGQMVETARASFPSGHATTAAVTALALVIVFTHPGSARRPWKAAAALFIGLMAWSRTYVHAHWLSDVLAGVLLGSATALLTFTTLCVRRRHSAPGDSSSAGSSGPASAGASDP
jgi:membrane-associated phospholipid phosphatase